MRACMRACVHACVRARMLPLYRYWSQHGYVMVCVHAHTCASTGNRPLVMSFALVAMSSIFLARQRIKRAIDDAEAAEAEAATKITEQPQPQPESKPP